MLRESAVFVEAGVMSLAYWKLPEKLTCNRQGTSQAELLKRIPILGTYILHYAQPREGTQHTSKICIVRGRCNDEVGRPGRELCRRKMSAMMFYMLSMHTTRSSLQRLTVTRYGLCGDERKQAMSLNSTIQWTDATLNSLIGCFVCSPGCRHCYARYDVNRMAANPKLGAGGKNPFRNLVQIDDGALRWTGKIRFLPERLYSVLTVKGSRKYFVNSLSDLFYEELPEEIIQEHFRVFRAAPWHTFQALTKRSARLLELSPKIDWPDNVWMGVSVESPRHLGRINDLGQTGAKLKWVSFEPWISGKIPLRRSNPKLRTTLRAAGIRWCVIGGESTKTKTGARPMSLDDLRYIIAESEAAGAAVFVKQLGTAWAIDSETYGKTSRGTKSKRLAKAKSGGNSAVWPKEFKGAKLRSYPTVPSVRWTKPLTTFQPSAKKGWKKWATTAMEANRMFHPEPAPSS
jgi:protein gp37